MNKDISLFLPYYTPKDQDRAAEINFCLQKNCENSHIRKIFLLKDDVPPCPIVNEKIDVIQIRQRPTYGDWLRLAIERCPDNVAILANSDIYFDDTILHIAKLFSEHSRSFAAISRYDKIGENIAPHPNPHWSQDTWAVVPSEIEYSVVRSADLIPLGKPRCDNKIAYLFAINGYKIFNPVSEVKTIHVHESGLRYYDKRGDTDIKGGMAMVHPSRDLETPSLIDVEIWTKASNQISSVKINRSFEKWEQETTDKRQKEKGIFTHDSDWQYPAITEKHAFDMMEKSFSGDRSLPKNTAYVAFPWATLIDLKTHAQHRKDKITTLEQALSKIRSLTLGYQKLITVCQHIRMRQFQEIFASVGITDIYWSHCEKSRKNLSDDPEIRIHPFPLYPVQRTIKNHFDEDNQRDILFSFVGAKSSNIYLTDCRNIILDLLKDDERGVIIDRSTWHYNKIVYDKQITGRSKSDVGIINDSATEEFKRMMSRSVFTLCPSGTGPNSIRLWEAIENGSIPVVMADNYCPPNSPELWEMATVTCKETPEAIRELPNRLQAIYENQAMIKRKRLALFFLMEKYGSSNFIHDIICDIKATNPSTLKTPTQNLIAHIR